MPKTKPASRTPKGRYSTKDRYLYRGNSALAIGFMLTPAMAQRVCRLLNEQKGSK